MGYIPWLKFQDFVQLMSQQLNVLKCQWKVLTSNILGTFNWNISITVVDQNQCYEWDAGTVWLLSCMLIVAEYARNC
jgi:hypothetical protein